MNQLFSKSSSMAQIPWGHRHGKLLRLLTSSSRLREVQRLDDVALGPTSRRLYFPPPPPMISPPKRPFSSRGTSRRNWPTLAEGQPAPLSGVTWKKEVTGPQSSGEGGCVPLGIQSWRLSPREGPVSSSGLQAEDGCALIAL